MLARTRAAHCALRFARDDLTTDIYYCVSHQWNCNPYRLNNLSRRLFFPISWPSRFALRKLTGLNFAKGVTDVWDRLIVKNESINDILSGWFKIVYTKFWPSDGIDRRYGNANAIIFIFQKKYSTNVYCWIIHDLKQETIFDESYLLSKVTSVVYGLQTMSDDNCLSSLNAVRLALYLWNFSCLTTMVVLRLVFYVLRQLGVKSVNLKLATLTVPLLNPIPYKQHKTNWTRTDIHRYLTRNKIDAEEYRISRV